MAATLTTLANILKIDYEDSLRDAINKSRPLFERITNRVTRKDYSGERFEWALKTANSQGSGAIGEEDVLPEGGNVAVARAYAQTKGHYAVARFTKRAMTQSMSNVGAFAAVAQTEMESIRDQMRDDLWVSGIFGDGTGEIGRVGAYSGTTLTARKFDTNVGDPGTRFLRKNMQLQSWAGKTGGAVAADHKQVSAITGTTTATVPAAAGFVAGDYLFRSVTAGVDPRSKCIMGLGGIVDDGTRVASIFNITRSAEPVMKAGRLGNSGVVRAWTRELMDEAAAEAWSNGGGGWPTAIYSNVEIQRRAAAALYADRRATMKEMELAGGYKTVAWMTPNGEKPWIADQAVRPNEILFVNEEDLFWLIDEDIQFETGDGGELRFTDRKHIMEAWLYTFRNLCSRQCHNHTALVDISTSL